MRTAERGGWRRAVRISLVLQVAMLPAAGRADWLILQTGERVETKGHWTVKGKQIVYTSLDQALLSVRLSEVDLAASTRASAQEPPSKKETYRDLGVELDMLSYKAAKEFSRLNAWITNPNAPRASGSVSVPGLRLTQNDLAQEGRRILENPAAVEAELLKSAAEIDAEFNRCLQANAQGDQSACVNTYVHDADGLRQRAVEIYVAVDAARTLDGSSPEVADESAAEAAADPQDPPQR